MKDEISWSWIAVPICLGINLALDGGIYYWHSVQTDYYDKRNCLYEDYYIFFFFHPIFFEVSRVILTVFSDQSHSITTHYANIAKHRKKQLTITQQSNLSCYVLSFEIIRDVAHCRLYFKLEASISASHIYWQDRKHKHHLFKILFYGWWKCLMLLNKL